MSEPEVVDNLTRSRFEIIVDGARAGMAVYTLSPGRIVFLHTEIADEHEGKGLGGVLVRAALDRARIFRLQVVPSCPFVRSWIERHPEYRNLLR